MAKKPNGTETFNVVFVGQNGRLGYKALLFSASLCHHSPDFQGKSLIAEPQPGPKWPNDPRLKPDIFEALKGLDAGVVPFESKHFGTDYAYGNKIEMLSALPKSEPFVFFDTDTLITDNLMYVPFDFDRIAAA